MHQVTKAATSGHNYFKCREHRCTGIGKAVIDLVRLAKIRAYGEFKRALRLDCGHDLEITLR